MKATLLIILGSFFLNCQNYPPHKDRLSESRQRELANLFLNKELYHQAIAEYQNLLDKVGLGEEKQASLCFIMGEVYLDKLHDYENAMAQFLRVEFYCPDCELVKDAKKNIVTCLERMDRPVDAQQVMKNMIALDSENVQSQQEGTIVARLGEKNIFLEDIENLYGKLPPRKIDKLNLIQNYIAFELLFEKAKRTNIERDPAVAKQLFQLKKNLLIQKTMEQELQGKLQIDTAAVTLFYLAHQQKYTKTEKTSSGKETVHPLSLEEARSQVVQDYLQSKQQEIYQATVSKLMATSEIKIFEELVPEEKE